MRWRSPGGWGFHTKLTLTIAGSFIGATAVILLIGLLAAKSLGIGVVALNQGALTELPAANDGFPGEATAVVAGRSDEGAIPSGGTGNGGISVVYGYVDGDVTRIGRASLERLPTLIRWSVAVLVIFAVVAIVIASTISRRSLNRIAEVTRLAQGLSESNLDRRLNLPGPDDEIRQLGDTFDGMLGRLESGFERQRQFVANASHELRTPLTTARVALEIPLAHGMVPPELEPAVRIALKANERSEQLIAALLGLARAQYGDPNAVRMTAFAVVVHEAIAEREEFAASRRITLHPSVEEGIAVMGDPVLLGLAVGNLVENAIRHNHDEGEVWLTLCREDAGMVLTIANTGSVIDGDVDRLREPFYRHDATRTQAADGRQGFGLGLALTDSVIGLHHGSLLLAAREGGGLLVTMTLPLAPLVFGDVPG